MNKKQYRRVRRQNRHLNLPLWDQLHLDEKKLFLQSANLREYVAGRAMLIMSQEEPPAINPAWSNAPYEVAWLTAKAGDEITCEITDVKPATASVALKPVKAIRPVRFMHRQGSLRRT